MYKILIGLILSFTISFPAYRKNSLSVSGLISAIFLGTVLYYTGGLLFFITMISFFVSSSLLTKYKSKIKFEVDKIHEKDGKRGITQVIANGFLGLFYAVAYYLTKNNMFVVAYGVAMASSNSDTWASEIGVLSHKNPVSIINFKPVERGLSGGVSSLGILASFMGSLFIGLIFFTLYGIEKGFNSEAYFFLILCVFGGFIGSLIDSLMGETLQAKYFSEKEGKVTERKYSGNNLNRLVRGFSFVDNEFVNFFSSTAATLIILLIYWIKI